MASHADSSSELLSTEEQVVPLKRAPTLYAIIFFKLAKGILFFFFGLVLYFQAHRNLPQEYSDLLKKPIFQNLRIHPENKLVQHIADQIADLTEERIKWAALGTMAWSLLPSVEGIGLLFRWTWAGWTAIAETAFFIPIEFYEMAKEFSFYLLLVTLANILIVWYLYANRDRLFHHHHHRGH
jgi:uncharacterized membrane protein (DUF2068 family)